MRVGVAVIASALMVWGLVRLEAQRGNAAPARAPKAAAPIDLTGYWVSIVTQDWRWRMVTPARGDYLGIPMTVEAKKVADAWDPAKDEAAGEQCRSYGAPALMSVPARLHITWQDDNVLKVDTDAGTQPPLCTMRHGPGRACRWPSGSRHGRVPGLARCSCVRRNEPRMTSRPSRKVAR